MTALTVPTRAGRDAGVPPVPWRRMAWVTWRQHRVALAGVAAFLGAFAAYLWLSGLAVHHAYATACHDAGSYACTVNLTARHGITSVVVSVLSQAVPALIGAFVGAPVLAREMETGTFRYAWTQGIGRWRWTLGKLVPLAVLVTAAAGGFSALLSWYNQPFVATGSAKPFGPRLFDLGGVAFAAWTLTAFAIGVLAGVLVRRIVPAIAATLAGYFGLALPVGLFLRQHYLPPLVTSNPDLSGSAWTVGQWYTRDGTFAFSSFSSQMADTAMRLCPELGGAAPVRQTPGVPAGPARCLTQHGYTLWTSYQPGSRYWPFQWIEAGWLLALSVLLIAVTVWLVRRRAT